MKTTARHLYFYDFIVLWGHPLFTVGPYIGGRRGGGKCILRGLRLSLRSSGLKFSAAGFLGSLKQTKLYLLVLSWPGSQRWGQVGCLERGKKAAYGEKRKHIVEINH